MLIPKSSGRVVKGLVVLLLLCFQTISQPQQSQTTHLSEINRTTLSNGNILLNSHPFPMVLDAGTDTFTPAGL
jgi:hypothetical protein